MPVKSPSLSEVVAMLDHPRASVTWIVRAILRPDGTPGIERLARIVAVYPRDGAGRLKMCVTDWGKRNERGEPAHYIATASGYGYDKRTACLDGMTLGGFEVGDHCNGRGVPTPRELVNREGWETFGQDCP